MKFTHRFNTNKIEIRTQTEELRFVHEASGARTVSGYAVLWNTPSFPIGADNGFIEKVAPYAFRDSLAANDIRLLREHKPELLLARTSSKTLAVTEDERGLKFSASLPDSPIGQDTAVSLERRDLKGMSFGFQAISANWGNEGKQVVRTLNKCRLAEISIVGDPAYAQTSVDVRSIPSEFRAMMTRSNDDGCNCDCDSCTDGDCSGCSMEDCEDAECAANGCPAQNDDGGDGFGERSRVFIPEPEDLARYMRLQIATRR
jgi:HK97 family phage prohead protease